jgi:hypothetical protein
VSELEDAETRRLLEDARRERNWKRWGPYLSERQWGTVREDYSADGNAWAYFPHSHAPHRAYRWGEDGLLGICDRQARLCFALALWNERDPILKERLFGLAGPEGNHGEDVKELYYYLAATPTASYLRGLYKYPQRRFPYEELVERNRRRSRQEPEYELLDTGIFDDGRYFDVEVEYAKAAPDDVLVQVTVHNRGPETARLHVLPTLWFRNTWSWGRIGEGYPPRPALWRAGPFTVRARHATLGDYVLHLDPGTRVGPGTSAPPGASRGTSANEEAGAVDARGPLFCDNETNAARLFGSARSPAHPKDAFHDRVVGGREGATNPAEEGTKCAGWYVLDVPAGGAISLRGRLCEAGYAACDPADALGPDFDATFAARRAEHEAFYARKLPRGLDEDERRVAMQAYAGLVWTKQYYGYVVREWLEGDPAQPPPPPERRRGRNADWLHLHNHDVISMPDKWEYPWYAAWDLAFHMLPFARIDPEFAKEQLVLFLREWYLHPNGQIPAYEWNFGDVNPPVHAWAAWRVYKMTAVRGHRDHAFLARVFQKLLLNFTWWVNRKDAEGNHLFGGGFLGLDNVGVFDRSKPLPGGARLDQADGTAWMAFYCTTMLAMALELARHDPIYEDVASKFFEHFVAITDAMNAHGGTGLWNEEDGYYYDQLLVGGRVLPLRLRSMVGIIPLFAVETLDDDLVAQLPGFAKRLRWFLENRRDLARHTEYRPARPGERYGKRLLAVPSRERLVRVLRYVLDEAELLSPWGVRSLSRVYAQRPFRMTLGGETYTVRYVPAESDSAMFGGNSNWRGPVWMPTNFLLVEALERYHHFYGEELRVEHPFGSGRMCTLAEVARDLEARLARPFLADARGRRPCHGDDRRYAEDPAFRDLVLFYEHFCGDTGRGVGASHQTGWTALVALCIEDAARRGR